MILIKIGLTIITWSIYLLIEGFIVYEFATEENDRTAIVWGFVLAVTLVCVFTPIMGTLLVWGLI